MVQTEVDSFKSLMGLLFGGGLFVGGLILISILVSAIVVVGPGERAVIFHKIDGVEQRALGEGLHILIPYIETWTIYNVKILREDEAATAASKDLQDVMLQGVVNYHVNPELVWKIHQEIGRDYNQKVIDPAIKEGIKAVTARFTAEELITKRETVKQQIKEEIKERLSSRWILIDEFSIADIQFSSGFNKAIDAKQVAEQNAQKAERDLDRIKIEAQQKIVQAEAEAESVRLNAVASAEAVRLNAVARATEVELDAAAKAEALRIQQAALERAPEVLRYKTIERWDGQLPRFTGGAIPFIDAGSII